MSASRPDPRPGDDVAVIMVVCTGNIARSPLAMAMLEEEARRRVGADPRVWVRSSGVHALEGHPAVADSRAAAEVRGLDLSAHRGCVTDRDAVLDADLVLVMTESQRAKVLRRAPAAGRHTFTLREFARLVAALKPLPDELGVRERVRFLVRLAHGARAYVARPDDREDVADPYGGPAEGYTRMATELDELIATIAPALFGGAGRDPA